MNNYALEGFLGEGAYGIVLKAVAKKSHEVVAIKKFKDKDTDNPLIKKVIVRELRALRALKHPNIVQLREAFKQSERLFLVFEFCEQSLLDLQMKAPGGRLPLGALRGLGREVLEALEFMHGRAMVHRDVKPENILVTKQGHAKLCDFGFARVVKRGEELTDYVATRWYRSPELLLTPFYAAPADIWAMGCVLSEAISGQPLFPGEDFIDQLRCIHAALGAFPAALLDCFDPQRRPEGFDFDFFRRDPPAFSPRFLQASHLSCCQNPELVDLIERLLALDPQRRLTARGALDHPFFAERAREGRPPSLRSPRVEEKENALSQPLALSGVFGSAGAKRPFLPQIRVPAGAKPPSLPPKTRFAARKA